MKILYLEDQKDKIAEVENCLTKYSYAVLSCDTIADALRMLDKADFDLVISGTHLQSENPFDLVRSIRKHPNTKVKELPIILLDSHQTAFARAVNGSMEVSCHMLEVNHYLAMPTFNSKQLRELLEQTIKAVKYSNSTSFYSEASDYSNTLSNGARK